MIDQMAYHWLDTAMGTGVIRGRCLNIGLGAGLSARLLLALRLVDSVHSLEIDPKAIDAYRQQYPKDEELEGRHEIFEGDILTTDTWPSLYDFVLLDVEFNATDCLTAMTQIGTVLDVNGAVVAEALPRETVVSGWATKKAQDPDALFWEYMNANWELVEIRPALSPTGEARAGAMRYMRQITQP